MASVFDDIEDDGQSALASQPVSDPASSGSVFDEPGQTASTTSVFDDVEPQQVGGVFDDIAPEEAGITSTPSGQLAVPLAAPAPPVPTPEQVRSQMAMQPPEQKIDEKPLQDIVKRKKMTWSDAAQQAYDDGLMRLLPVAMTAIDVGETAKLYSAGKALENGTATPEQKKYLTDYATKMADREGADKTIGYKATEMLLRLPAHALEFGMSAGFGKIGVMATRKVLGEGAKLAARKSLIEAARKSIAEGTTKEIAEASIKTLGREVLERPGTLVKSKITEGVGRFAAERVAAAGAMTALAPLQVARVASDTMRRMAPELGLQGGVGERETVFVTGPGADLGEAMARAYGINFVENLSELMGDAFEPISALWKGNLAAPIKLALGRRWIGRAAGRTFSMLMDTVDKLGWNGVLAEFAEERFADILRPAVEAIGSEETYAENFKLPSASDLAGEIVALSAFGFGASVLNKRRQQVKDFRNTAETKQLSDLTTQEIETRFNTPEYKQSQQALFDSHKDDTILIGGKLEPVLKGATLVDPDAELQGFDKTTAQFVRAYSERVAGAPVVFVKGLLSSGYRASRDGAVFLDVSKPYTWMGSIYGHEWKHQMDKDAEFQAANQEFRRITEGDAETKTRLDEEFQKIADTYQIAGDINDPAVRDTIWNEFTPRIFETLFAEQSFQEKILESNPGVIEKFIEVVREIFTKFAEVLNSLPIGTGTYTRVELEDMFRNISGGFGQIEGLYVAATRNFIERRRAAGLPVDPSIALAAEEIAIKPEAEKPAGEPAKKISTAYAEALPKAMAEMRAIESGGRQLSDQEERDIIDRYVSEAMAETPPEQEPTGPVVATQTTPTVMRQTGPSTPITRVTEPMAEAEEPSGEEARAFHGTQALWAPEPGFPNGRARLDKVGSGTGGAVYGWGAYLAGSESIASKYKREDYKRYVDGVDVTGDTDKAAKLLSLSKTQSLDVKLAFDQLIESGSVDNAIGKLIDRREAYARTESDRERYNAIIRILRDKAARMSVEKYEGSLYSLDIPDDVIPKLIDWENKVTVGQIRAIINSPLISGKKEFDELRRDLENYGEISRQDLMSGSGLYAYLEGYIRRNKIKFADVIVSPDELVLEKRKASRLLDSAGIPGIKFFGKGADGREVYNYVIWNQGVLDGIAVLERNGKKLDAIMGEQTAPAQAGGEAAISMRESARARLAEAEWNDSITRDERISASRAVADEQYFRALESGNQRVVRDIIYKLSRADDTPGIGSAPILRDRDGNVVPPSKRFSDKAFDIGDGEAALVTPNSKSIFDRLLDSGVSKFQVEDIKQEISVATFQRVISPYTNEAIHARIMMGNLSKRGKEFFSKNWNKTMGEINASPEDLRVLKSDLPEFYEIASLGSGRPQTLEEIVVGGAPSPIRANAGVVLREYAKQKSALSQLSTNAKRALVKAGVQPYALDGSLADILTLYPNQPLVRDGSWGLLEKELGIKYLAGVMSSRWKHYLESIYISETPFPYDYWNVMPVDIGGKQYVEPLSIHAPSGFFTDEGTTARASYENIASAMHELTHIVVSSPGMLGDNPEWRRELSRVYRHAWNNVPTKLADAMNNGLLQAYKDNRFGKLSDLEFGKKWRSFGLDDNTDWGIFYAFSAGENPHGKLTTEFLTQVTSSPSFRTFLASIKDPDAPKQTLWDRMVSFIMRMLGHNDDNNLLRSAINLILDGKNSAPKGPFVEIFTEPESVVAPGYQYQMPSGQAALDPEDPRFGEKYREQMKAMLSGAVTAQAKAPKERATRKVPKPKKANKIYIAKNGSGLIMKPDDGDARDDLVEAVLEEKELVRVAPDKSGGLRIVQTITGRFATNFGVRDWHMVSDEGGGRGTSVTTKKYPKTIWFSKEMAPVQEQGRPFGSPVMLVSSGGKKKIPALIVGSDPENWYVVGGRYATGMVERLVPNKNKDGLERKMVPMELGAYPKISKAAYPNVEDQPEGGLKLVPNSANSRGVRPPTTIFKASYYDYNGKRGWTGELSDGRIVNLSEDYYHLAEAGEGEIVKSLTASDRLWASTYAEKIIGKQIRFAIAAGRSVAQIDAGRIEAERELARLLDQAERTDQYNSEIVRDEMSEFLTKNPLAFRTLTSGLYAAQKYALQSTKPKLGNVRDRDPGSAALYKARMEEWQKQWDENEALRLAPEDQVAESDAGFVPESAGIRTWIAMKMGRRLSFAYRKGIALYGRGTSIDEVRDDAEGGSTSYEISSDDAKSAAKMTKATGTGKSDNDLMRRQEASKSYLESVLAGEKITEQDLSSRAGVTKAEAKKAIDDSKKMSMTPLAKKIYDEYKGIFEKGRSIPGVMDARLAMTSEDMEGKGFNDVPETIFDPPQYVTDKELASALVEVQRIVDGEPALPLAQMAKRMSKSRALFPEASAEADNWSISWTEEVVIRRALDILGDISAAKLDAAYTRFYRHAVGRRSKNNILNLDMVDTRALKILTDALRLRNKEGDQDKVLRLMTLRIRAGTAQSAALYAQRQTYAQSVRDEISKLLQEYLGEESRSGAARTYAQNNPTAPQIEAIAYGFVYAHFVEQSGIKEAQLTQQQANAIEKEAISLIASVRTYLPTAPTFISVNGRNVDNPEYRIQMGQYLRSVSALTTGFGAKALEFWKSSILSGIGTTVVQNPLSNLANGIYEFGPKRLMQSMLSALPAGLAPSRGAADVDAYIGEIPRAWNAMFKSTLDAAKIFWTTWRSEVPYYGVTKAGGPGFIGSTSAGELDDRYHAIGGIGGRVVRWPLRLLSATDDFFKHIFFMGHTTAYAYREAMDQKSVNPAFDVDSYIAAQISNPDSNAYRKGMEMAFGLVFQERLGKGGQALVAARSQHTALEFILPFVTTPLNIFKKSIRISPLGTPIMLYKLAKSKINQSGTLPKKQTYTREMFIENLAEQTLAWATVMVIASLIPDDDDDEKPGVQITGGRSLYKKDAGKQQTFERDQGPPPMSIKIGSGPWVSYARIEPLASTLAPIVNAIQAMREVQNGDEFAKAASDAMQKTVDAMSDKTFLGSLSDIVRASQSPEDAVRWAGNFASSWMPAVIRNAFRASVSTESDLGYKGKPLSMDWWKSVGKVSAESALPGQFSVQRVDWLGRDVMKSGRGVSPNTDVVYRILNMGGIQLKSDEQDDLSRMITNWNSRSRFKAKENFEYYPSKPSKWIDRKGERKFLTDDQYVEYQKLIGKMTQQFARSRRFNYDNPTLRDIEALEKIRANAVERAGNMIARKYRL